ncbi:MAG TPA: chemotaxis protein CheB [Chloroflexota bacterium]|nr:chemotaxis protein CheB [Chloroflexota bacterium]
METPAPGYRLIVVGVSAGGLFALRTLVGGLPEEFDLPVAVVQHRSRDSLLLCELLQECSELPVGEVSDKEEIVPGRVYVAPPDYHLLVEEPGWFALSTDEPVRYSRPSIDVLFLSAADAYGLDTIGVVLTGANTDGARGLRRIADLGGHAVVQDPATAEVKVMPQAALRAVPEACVLPLEQIPRHLAAIRGRRVPSCRTVPR